jgi:hypothetical protein
MIVVDGQISLDAKTHAGKFYKQDNNTLTFSWPWLGISFLATPTVEDIFCRWLAPAPSCAIPALFFRPIALTSPLFPSLAISHMPCPQTSSILV